PYPLSLHDALPISSISLRPISTSRSKKRFFFTASIGSTIAWLPSRRSVESQRGGLVIVRAGHCRSGKGTCGKGRYLRLGSLSIAIGSALSHGGRAASTRADNFDLLLMKGPLGGLPVTHARAGDAPKGA